MILKNFVQYTVISCAMLFSANTYSAEDDLVLKEDLTIIENGKVSIQAKNVLLSLILDELYEKVHFRLHEYVSTEVKLVEVDIEALPWEKAISKLLSGWDYTLTMDAISATPKILIISGKQKYGDSGSEIATAGDNSKTISEEESDSIQELAEQPVGRSAEEIEAEIRAAEVILLAPVDQTDDAVTALEAAQQDLRDASAAELQFEGETGEPSEEYMQSQREYLDALAYLGNFDDSRAVEALVSPLSDDALPEARLTALESLAGLSATQENPGAVNKALSIATISQDSHEQRAALEVIVRYAAAEDVLPIIEQLALSDGPNRDLAVREWLRIKEEQAARLRIEEEGDPQLK